MFQKPYCQHFEETLQEQLKRGLYQYSDRFVGELSPTRIGGYKAMGVGGASTEALSAHLSLSKAS